MFEKPRLEEKHDSPFDAPPAEAKFDITKFDATRTAGNIIDAIHKMADCEQFFWSQAQSKASEETLTKFSKDVENFIAFLDQRRILETDPEKTKIHTTNLIKCLKRIDKLVNLIFTIRGNERTDDYRGKIVKYMKF